MRIVIAGATGFIGRALTDRLMSSKHSIVVLSRREGSGNPGSSPLLVFAHWDGKSVGPWARYIDGADAVINLSGASIGSGRWTRSRKVLIRRSRLDSTSAIVAAIRQAGARPGVMINASAVGYYGNVPEGDVSEDHPQGSDFLSGVCADWEREALEAAKSGVRTVLLRSGLILDPRGGALQRMLLPYRFFVGGPLGTGRQWVPWIHHTDEIEAIVFALEHTHLSGPVNLSAPVPVTMEAFSRVLGEVLHRPAAFRVPPVLLKVVLGEMSSIVLTGQRAVPDKLLRSGFKFNFTDLRSALEDLLNAPAETAPSVDGNAKIH